MKNLQKIFAALIVTIAFLALQINLVNAAKDPIIQIESGKIRGGIENGVAYFKGIPYAAPPVGNLRWQPPQAPENWSGILETKNYSERAIQNFDLGVFSQSGGSEDCLYLNVFTDEKVCVEIKSCRYFSGFTAADFLSARQAIMIPFHLLNKEKPLL